MSHPIALQLPLLCKPPVLTLRKLALMALRLALMTLRFALGRL
jgi:hypothetical protein